MGNNNEGKLKKLIIDKPRISGLTGVLKIISEVVSELIINQEDLSTFAIYGEWGTGKTSVCKNIYNHFDLETMNGNTSQSNGLYYIPVWFDAWRYQHEEELYPAMLRTISESVIKYAKDNKGKEIGQKLLNSAIIIGKSLLSGVKIKTPGIEFSANDVINRLNADFEKHNKSQTLNIDDILESQYFKAYKLLKDVINDIKINNKKIRIILFIDDLDRCLPYMAFRIIEQIKVWFDIEGYIICLALHKKEIVNVVAKHMKTQLALNEENAIKLADEYLLKVISFGIDIDSLDKKKNEKMSKIDERELSIILQEKLKATPEKDKPKDSIRKTINKVNEEYLQSLIIQKFKQLK